MSEKDHLQHADVTIDPDVQHRLEKPHLPPPASGAGGMLPGIAGIALFMLFICMMGAFAAARGVFTGASRYLVLSFCTLAIIGVFGMLRLRRWGWALVNAGCLMMSVGYFWKSRVDHDSRGLVMAAFSLMFFFYLSRTEVRDRLR